jgi:hypothetical protein
LVGGQHRIAPILNLATGNSPELVENGVGGGDFEGHKGRFEGNKYSDTSGGLGVKNMIQFNQVLLGCGNMLWRGRLCGDLRWTINMIVWGEVGVLRRLQGTMVLECGNV